MKKYIIVDLEATCYDDNDKTETKPDCFVNEIIEIGAIMLDENGKYISEFNKFCKPLLHTHISNFCTQLTTITQKDVDNSDNIKFVLEDFMRWCGDDCVFISWGHYDKTQLLKDFVRNDLERFLDKLENHFSLKHLHAKWNKLKQTRGVGMSRALKMEGLIQDGTHHRGIDDARNITKIFLKYIDKF